MRRIPPFVWLLIGIFAVIGLLLLARGGDGAVSVFNDPRTMRAVALGAILIFVISGVVARGSFGRIVRYGLIWALVVAVLLVGYTYRDELGDAAQRVMTEVFPGQRTVEMGEDGNSVVITRSTRSLHFSVTATVDNAPVDMLIDTGASVITLTVEDAQLAGISTRSLRYDVVVQTANGSARAAPVILDTVAIGPIVLRRVSALVAERGMLETSLLGLNFLNELSSFTIAGNTLTLVR